MYSGPIWSHHPSVSPQDPMNPSDTVIVIRSLVPGGAAQLDGRLIPGDRLMSVNDVHLENATLDEAVQALKGAPMGAVRIGVAKPLPLAADTSSSQVGEAEAAAGWVIGRICVLIGEASGHLNQLCCFVNV